MYRCSKSVRNEGTAQFLPQRKEPKGSWGLAELERSLAVASKSRRLGERQKATRGGCWKTIFQRLEGRNKLKCFLMMWEMWGSDGLKVVINGMTSGVTTFFWFMPFLVFFFFFWRFQIDLFITSLTKGSRSSRWKFYPCCLISSFGPSSPHRRILTVS